MCYYVFKHQQCLVINGGCCELFSGYKYQLTGRLKFGLLGFQPRLSSGPRSIATSVSLIILAVFFLFTPGCPYCTMVWLVKQSYHPWQAATGKLDVVLGKWCSNKFFYRVPHWLIGAPSVFPSSLFLNMLKVKIKIQKN